MNLKSISLAFLAFMISLLTIISLSLLCMSHKILGHKLSTDYTSNASEQMNLIAESINEFYFRIDQDLELFATHPLLTSDKDKLANPHDWRQSLYYLLAQYATNHSGIQSIYFITTDNQYILWPHLYVSNDFTSDLNSLYTFFESNGRTIFKSSAHLDLHEHAVTSRIHPVYDADENILGIIGMDVSQAYISELLATKKTVSDTAFFMLFDDTGLIMADSKHPENLLKPMSELNILHASKIPKNKFSSIELVIDGDVHIGNIIHLPRSNWFIISFISKSELLAPVAKIIPKFILICALLLIAATVLTILATKKILYPKKAYSSPDTSLPINASLHDESSPYSKHELDELAIFLAQISSTSTSESSKDSPT